MTPLSRGEREGVRDKSSSVEGSRIRGVRRLFYVLLQRPHHSLESLPP
jgi:hypothetical protein